MQPPPELDCPMFTSYPLSPLDFFSFPWILDSEICCAPASPTPSSQLRPLNKLYNFNLCAIRDDAECDINFCVGLQTALIAHDMESSSSSWRCVEQYETYFFDWFTRRHLCNSMFWYEHMLPYENEYWCTCKKSFNHSHCYVTAVIDPSASRNSASVSLDEGPKKRNMENFLEFYIYRSKYCITPTIK